MDFYEWVEENLWGLAMPLSESQHDQYKQEIKSMFPGNYKINLYENIDKKSIQVELIFNDIYDQTAFRLKFC